LTLLQDLTVLIPHYNGWQKLKRAVASCGSLPVLIYDDGSSNSQDEFNLPNVKLHRVKKNQGVAVARDWLLKNCETRFGLFLDADDELSSEQYLREAVAVLNGRSDIAVVGCFAVDQYGNHKQRPLRIRPAYFLWRNPIVTSGAVMRCELARQFEVVDPAPVRDFAEDYYLWARLARDNVLVNLPFQGVKREHSEQSLTTRLGWRKRMYVALYTRFVIFIFFYRWKIPGAYDA
jgi:glycosyltransferase involved in cell wall biosynthesis